MRASLLGYNAAGKPVRLSADDRRAHMHVIGSSGSGKSKFLEWMMRGDLRDRRGFCLIDPHGELYTDILRYCGHHVSNREIILLDVSNPTSIVGFNPFRNTSGDISVQVDRRISATLHAWNVPNADQTPTLERTLRLVYTILIELGLGLPQIQHLIDFNAYEIREHLINRIATPLIRREWQELQQLKAREWRDEVLSAKNRLFRFLTSPALTRFMGLPEHSIDLGEVMDQGKVVLVNLNPSDYLSEENARVFGSLLVNEFFEAARRRGKDSRGRDPNPYLLYIDEFQNFVSLDVAEMLDQVRKRGVFLTLAHQRFGHLDENITDAVLTNCRLKAIFGGLPADSARRMAEELFIRDLDPKRVKVAIYQTKFWPTYERDQVYTKGRTTGRSRGESASVSESVSAGKGSGVFFEPADWFELPEEVGLSESESSGTGSTSSSGYSESESTGESESVADIPILIPVPFKELSSVQYYSLDEQLTGLTAALKEQFPRHCFIKIHDQRTQPLLVPFVKSFYTAEHNQTWYRTKLFDRYGALPAEEIDRLIAERETALVKAAQPPAPPPPVIPEVEEVEKDTPGAPEETQMPPVAKAKTSGSVKTRRKPKKPNIQTFNPYDSLDPNRE